MTAKRPWQETWDNGRDFEVTVSGPELDRSIDAPRELLARFAPDMARALKKALQVGRRRNSTVIEFHTPACWDGIYAYLKTGDEHGHADCEEMHSALKKAGVTLP